MLAIDAGPTVRSRSTGTAPIAASRRTRSLGLCSSAWRRRSSPRSPSSSASGSTAVPTACSATATATPSRRSTRQSSWGPSWSARRSRLRQNSFARRARRTGGEAWEPAVVIVASAHAGEVSEALLGRRARQARAGARGRRAGAGGAVVAGGHRERLDGAAARSAARARRADGRRRGRARGPRRARREDGTGAARRVVAPGGAWQHRAARPARQLGGAVPCRRDRARGCARDRNDAQRGHNGHTLVHRDIGGGSVHRCRSGT